MKKRGNRGPYDALIAAMLIFGSVGIFRRYIPLPSSLIALVRGGIGALALVALIFLRGGKMRNVRRNVLPLCLSGVMIGFNWILLFEAYNYTTVATATLCYYMAPIFVILLSPWVLREKLTMKKGVCALCAIGGMVLISGVLGQTEGGNGDLRGVALGLGAAVLYASVILTNKKIVGMEALDKTAVQLLSAAVVLLPYTLLTEDVSALTLTKASVALLIVMGVVHTGLAYVLYFGSVQRLPAQTTAIFSYIDPIAAILLSALLLRESMGWTDIIGTVLILGAAVVSEIEIKTIKGKQHDRQI